MNRQVHPPRIVNVLPSGEIYQTALAPMHQRLRIVQHIDQLAGPLVAKLFVGAADGDTPGKLTIIFVLGGDDIALEGFFHGHPRTRNSSAKIE
jgi:hypothetical protein